MTKVTASADAPTYTERMRATITRIVELVGSLTGSVCFDWDI